MSLKSDFLMNSLDHPATILVVDDNPANLNLISDHLTEFGFTVLVARDGLSALEKAQYAQPELILLDIMLPGIDGYEICRCLKQDEKTRPIPVIFMTVMSKTQDKIKGFQLGAVDYITKPFQYEEVLARIKIHLAMQTMQKQLEAQNVTLQQEIADRKRAEDLLQRANQELEQRVQQRTDNLAKANTNLKIEIIERLRVQAEVTRRNRELTLLNRVIAASVTENNSAAILQITCQELALAFEISQVSGLLVNPQKSELIIVAEYLTSPQPSGINQSIPLADNRLITRLVTNKAPVIITSTEYTTELADYRNALQHRSVMSICLVPLLEKEDLIGAFLLESMEYHNFSTEEIELAVNVANQVSSVIARIRLDAERRQLELQYHQAQKMEAMGLLAGGVAHDFNNILTAINGYADLIQQSLTPDNPIKDMATAILHSGWHAADLVRQLLVFSRKQSMEPKVINLANTVVEIKRMLRRIIGENIQLETAIQPDLWLIKVDPTQLEQVIVNLVVNARDAMPTGGYLTISLTNTVIQSDHLWGPIAIKPGEYVLLIISDNGCGMSKEVQAHIFEPFFTTKERGQGSGLGLANVFGIIKQSGGEIEVDSEEDIGSTFRIYLPRTIMPLNQPGLAMQSAMPVGNETILLVEDDTIVKVLVEQILHDLGYMLLTASNGQDALAMVNAYQHPIQLLLTDVVLPGMDGWQLSEQLSQLRPTLKTLFISGYADNVVTEQDTLPAGTAFLQKPFSPSALATTLRMVLDS